MDFYKESTMQSSDKKGGFSCPCFFR